MRNNDYSEEDEEFLFDEEMREEGNPYDYEVDETDEDTEYGDNPAWNW